MADTEVKSSSAELREILINALGVLNEFDKVKEKVHELIEQNDGIITLSQVHPAISRLSDAEDLAFYMTQGTNIESANFLKHKIDEIFRPATINCDRKSVSSVYDRLKETVQNSIRALDVFESDIVSTFDYEFSSEEKSELKHAIMTYLDGEYFQKIEISIPDKINGQAEISFIKEPFINYNDEFDSVFEDLISENKLTVQSVSDWLYENNKDFEWYEEEINYGEIRSRIVDYIESILDHLKPIEVEHFVNRMEILGSVSMTPVAKRIVDDIDTYCTRCDDLLTIENLRTSERLREIIWDSSEYMMCDKQFAVPEVFEYVSYSWIADGIENRKDTATGKKIIEMIKSNPKYADYGEDKLSDMIYSYVEDNPVKELGEIIREDKELVYEIIPEENLFDAGGVWVFFSN